MIIRPSSNQSSTALRLAWFTPGGGRLQIANKCIRKRVFRLMRVTQVQ